MYIRRSKNVWRAEVACAVCWHDMVVQIIASELTLSARVDEASVLSSIGRCYLAESQERK